jgi:hypothetical protein
MSNASDPVEPLISHWNALRRPSANRDASIVPTALPELRRRLEGVVDLAAGQGTLMKPDTRSTSPRGTARSTTCVPEVAERSRSLPRRDGNATFERRVVTPVLR